VKDIYPGSNSSSISDLTNLSGTLFFIAADGTYGQELWKSDGTAAGTLMLKDIRPGSEGSSISNLTNVDGTLFFIANDGTNGDELWKTDGTMAGTQMVKDIQPGSGSSLSFSYQSERFLFNANGTLLFMADDGVHGLELWKSDSTAAGTTLVKDIIPSGGSSSSHRQVIATNGTLFFDVAKWDAYPDADPEYGPWGLELWKSDGTTEGTVLVADLGPYRFGDDIEFLEGVSGVVYFALLSGVDEDDASGWYSELWASDGTAEGTVALQSLLPSDDYGFYDLRLKSLNGELYFVDGDSTNGRELWKTDGTVAGTRLVKDIWPGEQGSEPTPITAFDGKLYFIANDGYSGDELWVTDGTEEGTLQFPDIVSGSGGGDPQNLLVPTAPCFSRQTTASSAANCGR